MFTQNFQKVPSEDLQLVSSLLEEDRSIGTLVGVLTTAIVLILIVGTSFFYYKAKERNLDVGSWVVNSINSSFANISRDANGGNNGSITEVASSNIINFLPISRW